MATLTKPKKEKPRKQRVAAKSEEEVLDYTSLSTSSEQAEQRTNENEALMEELVAGMASSCNEIISHECYISNQPTEHTAQQSNEEQAEEKEEQLTTDQSTPSAPEVPATSVKFVQYPNLQSVRQLSNIVNEERTASTVYKTTMASQLQPFTAEELTQIYCCPDLELAKQFELEFLMNTLLESSEADPLYLELLEYYSLQGKITANLYDINEKRKSCKDIPQQVWQRESVTRSFSATCGDGNTVRDSITYEIMKMNGLKLESATAGLTSLYNLVCHTYASNLIAARISKVNVDQLIDQLLAYAPSAKFDDPTPIALHAHLDSDALECVSKLRRAICILFSFARRPSPNANFDADLKLWLRKLVGLLLLLATKEDHWFLLFNILRCPSGVGVWAAEFLQLPGMMAIEPNSTRHEQPLSLNSAELNHCIAVLQILLLPIKKRNEYLKSQTQEHLELAGSAGARERWIVVDSDGEDSHTAAGECVGLKESDIIELLNQLPFEKLFMSVMHIEKFLNDYIIESELITAQQMLAVVAVFGKLVQILGEGMLTYNNERYKQLAKRLGRLVRHVLQYVFDYHVLFLNNKVAKPPELCLRIETEVQALLLRACSYIYRSRNLGTWQYFSTLPYPMLSTEIIWQLFYFLNVGFPSEFHMLLKEQGEEAVLSPDFMRKFDVANADTAPEDMYYLLQAFFEMISERDTSKDLPLIRTICLHIFQIGYLHVTTREYCYKMARDMLVNTTLAHGELLDCILLKLKANFGDTKNTAYLLKALPLDSWRPSMESFELLSNWLLHYDYQLSENQIARLIICHMNWGFDEEGRLFLPHNIHVRMACLVTDALSKHAPEIIGVSSISESVRQVSSLIDSTLSAREHFSNWCWRMISTLRLHLIDQSVESVKRTLQHPTEPLLFVPNVERLDMIWQGITEQRPLAVFVGILVSLHGHSIPVICQHGFPLMQQLLTDHRHAAVIRCLQLILPLFLETPETLANCEGFQKLLTTLLNADRTYLKLAKDIVYVNSIGPILELLDNMIHHQILSYGLCSPLNLINIWLNCLTALPAWPQNAHVLYLLDKLLRLAYQFADCHVQSEEFFYNYYKDFTEWKAASKSFGLKSFFGAQSSSRLPAILPQYCWLNVVLLDLEFRLQETRFWPELLRQLSTQSVDFGLKKTLGICKTNAFAAQQLVIYKYAQLLSVMDITHALFPIVCQKFFELYLWRVPIDGAQSNFSQSQGVANKFYEHNVSLMKTIKSQMKSAEVYYDAIGKKRADDESAAFIFRSCRELMHSCALWLEDTQLNRFDSDVSQLPAQYNIRKLRELLNGHATHWTEYINPADLRLKQRQQADQWAEKVYRLHVNRTMQTPLQSKPHLTPEQRIKQHLKGYDKQLAAPTYQCPMRLEQQPIDDKTVTEFRQRVQTLNSTANKFHYLTSELNSLNLNYLERVPALYQMIPYNEVRNKNCESLLFNRKCASPATITLVPERIRLNDQVSRLQEQNRERHDKILDEMVKLDVDNFALACREMHCYIQQLLQQQDATRIQQIGIDIFYIVIENMSEVTLKFDATGTFFTQCADQLGVFIQADQANQGLTVLRLALKRAELLELLAGVFVPCRTDAEHFLPMYQFLIDSHLNRCDTKILFVLLSKFDLLSWLESYQPKLNVINRLLLLVLQGLECWTQANSSLLQDQFRRQLVHIYSYDFPQHYGEVMQLVLDRISDQKLMPLVLLDLLNALLLRANCASLTPSSTETQLHELSLDFAKSQRLFTLQAATDTLLLFARHFQKERLHHGLHGLYPKHKDYCQPLVMWFTSFGHVLIAAALVNSHKELLADQISDLVFGTIVETYAPWLIPYTEQTAQAAGSAAHWIRQLAANQGKMLLPWSESHVQGSKLLIRAFINSMQQVLQYLPVSSRILEHVFAWYVHHFAQANVAGHVLAPIHEGLAQLPWERFCPPDQHVELLYGSLQRFVPESHAMLGHIFIRIDWQTWFSCMPQPVATLSRLFGIFVKLAFEPNIHMHPNTSKILEQAIKYPWHLVEYSELEQLLKWLVASVEPAIVLKLAGESNYVDRAVLELLRLACAMLPDCATTEPIVQSTTKRMLYTRSMICLQRSCGAKHQKLLASKEGERAFTNAFLELLISIDQAIGSANEQRTPEERRREALNLMLELIAPTQTQSEEISNIHIKALVRWQQQCSPANILMCAALPAIGHLNTYIASIYTLLESTIECYFWQNVEHAPWHAPSWQGLLESLQMSLPKLELMPVMQGANFFSLHVFVLYRLEEIETSGEKIAFLQDLIQLLENVKTSPKTEPRLALVWGLIIARGCQLLQTSAHIKKPLHMLARSLQIASTKAEGWSDNLLGAIGLKSEQITNKRKVLTRCFACIIFSLFPASRDTRVPCEEYESGMRELAMLLANKKFTDVKADIVRAVSFLKEQPMPDPRTVPHLLCCLIDLFYQQSYLTTIPEVWDCDFKLKAT
ncbi:CG14299 [Drosophila busckii]|uniref:CG14299 n=1 Tax=Drosophila busckii TaxID=30019 RepID=A0A0M4F4G1_DROBS|nr:CG14299 [Drosophila busckii]